MALLTWDYPFDRSANHFGPGVRTPMMERERGSGGGLAVNGDFPAARLCHTIKRQDLWLVTASYRGTSLMAFPIDIRRPRAGGPIQQAVSCGFCGGQVTVVVYDAVRTSTLRRRWLACGLGGGLLAVLGILGLALPIGDVTAGSPLLGGLVLVIGTGVVLAIGFLRLWHDEDGVRSPRPSPGHSIRRHAAEPR
jgi:hypothetical protein